MARTEEHRNNAIEYGFSVHEYNDLEAKKIKSSGATWIRTDAFFGGSLGGLDETERRIDGYLAKGIKSLIIIDRATLQDLPSFNLEDWRQRVRMVAKRFAGKVPAYEIWNEPDDPGYWQGYMNSPQHYVDMVRVAREEIKAADPEALVVGPAAQIYFSSPGHTFVEEVFRSGLSNYIDGASFHLYQYVLDSAEQDIQGALYHMAGIASGKPIWITEIGEHSYKTPDWPGGDSEEVQADSMRTWFSGMESCKVVPEKVFWYTFVEPPQWNFSVLRQDYSEKLAYEVFKEFASS